MSTEARFQIIEEVGRGGMATVYRAYDSVAESEVALKVLHRHMAGEAAVREAFSREAELMRALDHPAVVRVFGTAEVEGLPAIVMELIEGGDVQGLLARRGQLEPAEALEIVVPVLEVLHEAHEKGILHRDIKPQNVLLDSEGRPRLIDFGIGKAEEWVEVAFDGQVGTVEYMAPERIDGMAVDGRSDLYSVAVMLYELLCGEVPFRGASAAEVMRMHREGQVPTLRSRRADIDHDVNDAVLRGLARFPEERYDHAEQMIQALRGEIRAQGHLEQHPEWLQVLEEVRESTERRLDPSANEEWVVYCLPSDIAASGSLATQVDRLRDGIREARGDLQMPDLGGVTSYNVDMGATVLNAPNGIPVARGLSRQGARGIIEVMEAQGFRVHFGSRPLGEPDGRQKSMRPLIAWCSTWAALFFSIPAMIAGLALYGLTVVTLETGPSPADISVIIPMTVMLGFFLTGFVPAILSVRRAMEGIRFNLVTEDFLLDFRDPPQAIQRTSVVKRRHVELFEALRSPRIRASYQRFMNLVLHLEDAVKRRPELADPARIQRAVRSASGAVEQIIKVEKHLAGVGTGELTSRLRNLERQIAAATSMEETERLMEERDGLRRRLQERERRQDGIQTLAQELLQATSGLEALVKKVRDPAQEATIADLVVLEFGAKTQYSSDDLHASTTVEQPAHESLP